MPLTTQAVLSFSFMGQSTSGDTDSGFQATFDDGTTLTVWVTEGINNGVKVCTSVCSTFASWPVALAWYDVVVTIDPSSNSVLAASTAVGTFGAVPLSGTATAIATMGFFAVEWTTFGSQAFHYDNLVAAAA
jgi:hypothetical protein